MKKVICLVGPTASGKTSLSIKIAKHFNLDIINGDSVAIKKRLDIGSAKITKKEMKGIKHHLLSCIHPTCNYSVFDYQKDVRKLIDKIDMPFIVGGSGFYIKSALYDYNFYDEKLNNKKISYEEALEYIKTKNIKNIDLNNPRRVIRTYHKLKQGVDIKTLNKKDKALYDILILYLDMPRNKQKKLMIERVEKQIKDGFIKEVENLRNDNIYIYDIIGYREINLYLDNKLSLEEAKKEIVNKTYKYAKRQKTWFKNQMNIKLLDPLSKTLTKDSINIIERFLNEK